LDGVYGSIAQYLSEDSPFLTTIKKQLTANDLFHIKENVYNIDFRVAQACYQQIHGNKIILLDNYSDGAILGILAQIRETVR